MIHTAVAIANVEKVPSIHPSIDLSYPCPDSSIQQEHVSVVLYVFLLAACNLYRLAAATTTSARAAAAAVMSIGEIVDGTCGGHVSRTELCR